MSRLLPEQPEFRRGRGRRRARCVGADTGVCIEGVEYVRVIFCAVLPFVQSFSVFEKEGSGGER